jgi:hypothetical protein
MTALDEGSATITATCEGKSGSASVTTTPVPVATVDVMPSSETIEAGETLQLTGIPKDADGNVLSGRPIIWSSSNASVATVSEAGLVSGVGAGEATITATCEGKSGTASMTVTITLTVTVSTSGPDPDPNGFIVRLDDSVWASIPATGVAEFVVASQGPHWVLLADISGNCAVIGENPRTITDTVNFQVSCVRNLLLDQGEAWNNVAPFGGTSDQRYQQLYSATSFGSGGRIIAISFFSPGTATKPLATADYSFRLSASPKPVSSMSHEMDENFGEYAPTVLSRHIEGLMVEGTLTFMLDEPFVYRPTEGNLLLDVVIENAVDDGQGTKVYAAVQNSPITSRRPAYGGAGDGYGLVTLFVLDSLLAPLPVSQLSRAPDSIVPRPFGR